MTHPSVTFIMAARNAASTVRGSLESILQQKYPGRVEVVVVDDASDDATPDIVAEYSNVVLLRNSQQQGRSVSRNRALEIVETTLVAVQDADDYSEPSRLSDTAALFRSESRTIVGGQVAWTDPMLGTFEGGSWPTAETETMSLLVQGRMPLAHPTMVLPLKLMQAVNGYNPRFPVGEDLDLLLRIKRAVPDVSILNSSQVVVQYHRAKMDKLAYVCKSAYWRQQIMNDHTPACPHQAPLSWVRNSVAGYVRQRARAAKDRVLKGSLR